MPQPAPSSTSTHQRQRNLQLSHSFALFRQDYARHNTQQSTPTAQEAGDAWRALSDGQRQYYVNLAALATEIPVTEPKRYHFLGIEQGPVLRQSAPGHGASYFHSGKRQKSPEPYVRETKAKLSSFPESPLCTDLRELILQWNKEHPSCRAAFYRARRGDTSDKVLVVKVKDVMTAYLIFGVGRDDGFVVEVISVFGPRETRAGPFSSSSYEVFRIVSERVGGILRAGPPVSVVLSLLESYSGLFCSACSVCGRILSAEGHVPVDRIWAGEWEAKHVACPTRRR